MYIDVNFATNDYVKNPPLVLAALELPDEIFKEESIDGIGVVKKSKGKSTFHILLLHNEVDVNCQNRSGFTALHAACSKGKYHMVTELLKVQKLAIDKEDEHHNTPLHAACTHGNQNVVESLIEAGADYCKKNNDGRHPLHVAVVERNLDAVNTIIRYAESANKAKELLSERDKQGNSIFLLAVLSGDEQMVKFLLDKKLASINDKNKSGLNCFHCAVSRNRQKILEMLYAYDESVALLMHDDTDTISGNTPLHSAAKNNQVESIRYLVYR